MSIQSSCILVSVEVRVPTGFTNDNSASGELAQRILEEARRHGVYITEDPRLVSLLGQLDLEQAIPEELYTAVAVVLSWSYWVRGMVPGDEKHPMREAEPGYPLQ